MSKKFFTLFTTFILILTLFSQNVRQVEAASKEKATVYADSLNVRSGPATKYKKIGSLKKGTKVIVYGKTKSGWSEILYKKKKGYVSTKYLTFGSAYKWTGKYYGQLSGNHAGTDMVIKNQKESSFEFEIIQWENGWVNNSEGGCWCGDEKKVLAKGKATFNKNKGIYKKNGKKVTFTLTKAGIDVRGGASTDLYIKLPK